MAQGDPFRRSEDAVPGSVSEVVVTAVAVAEGTAPTALPPLYEAIDPDALDTVAGSETVEVTFEYAGYEIQVDGREPIELESLYD